MVVGCGGDDAGTCTISQTSEGAAIIRCPDATEHILHHGEDGATGPIGPSGPSAPTTSCTLTDGPGNGMTLTCGRETVVIGEDCAEGYPGPLIISPPWDGELNTRLLHFELSGCSRINGDLRVEGYMLDSHTRLPHLLNRITFIEGNLTIGGWDEYQGNPELQEARFSQLREVGGDVTVIAGDGLPNGVDFPKLERVGGELSYIQSAALEQLGDLSSLRQATALRIYNNYALKEVRGLASLESLESLFIDGNESLTVIEAPAKLQTLDDGLHIYNNQMLSSVTPFTALSYVYHFQWTQNNALESIADFPALTRAGTVNVGTAELLHSLAGLSALRVVEFELNINSLPSLVSLAPLDNLAEVQGTLNIEYNSALSDAEIERFLGALSFEPEGWICENAGEFCQQ